ncbi:MAG: YIP1 family protein [Verrucomicrobiota bacterium]|nr:YIP1 family protein [Verrucomicrobiota bacterium]
MANFHVARGETKLGSFPEEEVKGGLASGRFLPTDLGWRDGMTTWQPLAQIPEFGGTAPMPPGSVPGATLPPDSTAGPVAVAPAAGTGLPWDRRQELGFFPAFFETLKLVLFNPTAAFSAMKPEGGFGEPLIYAVFGGSIGFIFYFLFSLLISSMGLMSDRTNALAGIMGLGIGTIFIILFVPVFIALGLFLGAGILHLCLMLVGGAKRSYETTFRVLSFTLGSTYPLMIVPVCGGFISGLWALVLECVGLARAHETTTGKAVLAVLLPVIVCCGGGLVLAIMFGTLGALTGQH